MITKETKQSTMMQTFYDFLWHKLQANKLKLPDCKDAELMQSHAPSEAFNQKLFTTIQPGMENFHKECKPKIKRMEEDIVGQWYWKILDSQIL